MTGTSEDRSEGLPLPGLDGSNPLAFMAALGVLRVLSPDAPSDTDAPRIRWSARAGSWVPELLPAPDKPVWSVPELLSELDQRLLKDLNRHPARIWQTVLEGDHGERCGLAEDGGPETLAWLGGLGIATVDTLGLNPEEHDTQLRTARRDYHLISLGPIIEQTGPRHLERTLFNLWDYADPMATLSLHIDPADDRRHAYQWRKPAGDPSRKNRGGMLGANRLAIEAFPLLTTVPTADGSSTAGFRGHRATDTYWRWPVWQVPVTAAVLPSLMQLADLQPARGDPSDRIGNAAAERLRERGIATVYESQRILVGKTPNLTPARAVM